MNLKDKLLAGLVSSSIIFFQVQTALAQTISDSDIKNTTSEFAVEITTDAINPNGEISTGGTGIIVARNGNTYYILTASHIIPKDNPDANYFVVTNKGNSPLTIKEQHPEKTTDIAELSFISDKNYTLAVIGNPMALCQGSSIYVAGWSSSGTRREMQFISGEFKEIINNPEGGGGQLLIYSGDLVPGFSGGPVLNQAGQLVGIHTRGNEGEVVGKGGQGISIATVREVVVIPEIKTALERTPSAPNVANQPPSSQNQPPVVVSQPPASQNRPSVVMSQPPTNEPVPNFSIVIKGSLW